VLPLIAYLAAAALVGTPTLIRQKNKTKQTKKREPRLKSPRLNVYSLEGLVLDGQSFRVNGFLAGNTFKSSEYAPIIIFVALHRETALSVSSRPSQTNEVFLRFAERGKCTQSEGKYAHCNGSSDTPMSVLAIADFRNRRWHNSGHQVLTVHKPDLIGVDIHLQLCSSLEVGQRSAIINNGIARIFRDHIRRERNGATQQQCYDFLLMFSCISS
jgi:hypothetical protein